MKYLILSLALLFFSSTFYNTSAEWLTNLESAQKISKTSKTPILLYFTGSDWCSPCKALQKDVFDSETFKSLANQLTLVKCDIPRRIDIISEDQMSYNKELMKLYNPEKSFPKLVALNSKGKVIDEITSYSSNSKGQFHFAFIEALVKD